MLSNSKKGQGFTIVELLIVIVVIGILAAITTVAFNGVQQRARDSQRTSDIAAITKALELYYLDNGSFPSSVAGFNTINTSWSTTADAGWAHLEAALVPKYLSKLPKDPISTPATNVQGSGYNYAYFRNGSNYCGSSTGQMYILIYRLESGERVNRLEGECPTNILLYGNNTTNRVSNVRIVK